MLAFVDIFYRIHYLVLFNLTIYFAIAGRTSHLDRVIKAKKDWKICKVWRLWLEEHKVIQLRYVIKLESNLLQYLLNFSYLCIVLWKH